MLCIKIIYVNHNNIINIYNTNFNILAVGLSAANSC